MCPSRASIAFVDNVLLEVMRLFPSRYIHLGGDEAPTVRWDHSPLVQDLLRREHLPNSRAAQGWFLRHIESFVRAHGRRVIGWDEILDAKPPRDTTIMSWRGMDGGTAAARGGHDAIMTPTDWVYLNYCQGDPATEPPCHGNYLPLRHVYDFEPVPPALTPQEERHILGGQGNLWTEYLTTPRAIEYMLWPRSLALAEIFWSPKQSRNWEAFKPRLAAQLRSLQRRGVNFRNPEVEGAGS